ncbi:DUF3431 domain-containing protein [Microdochium nivale]|nr:DUF3431 domain-containing protein [Microdochium nivale]
MLSLLANTQPSHCHSSQFIIQSPLPSEAKKSSDNDFLGRLAILTMLANRLHVRMALAIAVSIVLFTLLYLQPTSLHLRPNQHFSNHEAKQASLKLPSSELPEPELPSPEPISPEMVAVVDQVSHRVELIVASTKSEDTGWVTKHFTDWHPQIYVVDDEHAALTVPANRGREAMVYLTYIIDNYDRLPEHAVFIHASRFAWHNDDPDYDAVPVLRNLQLEYVREAGYVNLRCVWVIGCPAEIRPFRDEGTDSQGKALSTKAIYKQAFEELLPELRVPELVAVSCCSQFAVSRETLQSRPRSDYERYREWLMATSYTDDLSGRVFEFSWHIIFGKEPVFCPSANDCYCNVFGLCNITCSGGACNGRYTLPQSSTLPGGWPLLGWKHEHRNYTGNLD